MKSETNQESSETNLSNEQAIEIEGQENTAATAQTNEVTEEPASFMQQMEQLKQTAEDHYQRYLRIQADFDNFRRRSRQEREDFAKYASQKTIEGILPIVDNFERAMTATKDLHDPEALAKGVEMIHRQLAQWLEAEGVKIIQAVGQPFNPELHQAVMQVAAEDGTASGIVVEQLQQGYMLKDKVIRPSMVKVTE